jgi:hypothetical protein
MNGQTRIRAFNIEGVDVNSGTVLVEIDKAILAPMAKALHATPASGASNTHIACRSLAGHLRNACRVLYCEATPEEFGFEILEDVVEEPEAEAVAKTA